MTLLVACGDDDPQARLELRTPRPTRDCEAQGDLLRVAFAVRKRKIAEWRELPQPLESVPEQASERTPEPRPQTSA